MNLKRALQWLLQPIPAADLDMQVDKLMENLNSDDEVIRSLAEYTLAEMSANWETYYHADLMIAVLQGLEQHGCATSVPCVEHLAEQSAYTTEQQRVQVAAQACLPLLRARVEQEQMRGTLLRPSLPPNTSGAQLLRPAHGSKEIAASELLRASCADRDKQA